MIAHHGTILLADDEEKILKRLGRALRDEGHEVVEATTIRDAQRHLAQRAFDLLVVDNVMPDMSGLELIREVANTMAPGERRRAMRIVSAPIAPTPTTPTVSAGSIRARPSAFTTHDPGSTSAAASKETWSGSVCRIRAGTTTYSPQPPPRVKPTAS